MNRSPKVHDPFERDLVRLAADAATFDLTEHPVAEQKAHEASLAEQLDQHDDLRGTAPATYAQFRDAFDSGGDCSELVALRDAMLPADPLRVAANEDLRSVGCFIATSTRRGAWAPDVAGSNPCRLRPAQDAVIGPAVIDVAPPGVQSRQMTVASSCSRAV